VPEEVAGAYRFPFRLAVANVVLYEPEYLYDQSLADERNVIYGQVKDGAADWTPRNNYAERLPFPKNLCLDPCEPQITAKLKADH
jgi:hypothetical protein